MQWLVWAWRKAPSSAAAGEKRVCCVKNFNPDVVFICHFDIHSHYWLNHPYIMFRDCTVRVWRLSPGNPSLVKELCGHSELVHYVAIDQVPFFYISNVNRQTGLISSSRRGSTAATSLGNYLSGQEKRIKKMNLQRMIKMRRLWEDQKRKDW